MFCSSQWASRAFRQIKSLFRLLEGAGSPSISAAAWCSMYKGSVDVHPHPAGPRKPYSEAKSTYVALPFNSSEAHLPRSWTRPLSQFGLPLRSGLIFEMLHTIAVVHDTPISIQ
jgi:hypothetical protein